jgi:hypothetical protein
MTTHQGTLQILDPDQHSSEDTRSELARSSTTGTDYHPPGHRGVPSDERPSEDEPPHLQMGSPHENEPAPYDLPPKEAP